jgi:hypothetical protein
MRALVDEGAGRREGEAALEVNGDLAFHERGYS